MANVTENCTQCSTEEKCKSCSKCKNSLQSWCGKQEHRPNFVVAHTVCGKCIDDPVTLQSTCVRCGNRCHIAVLVFVLIKEMWNHPFLSSVRPNDFMGKLSISRMFKPVAHTVCGKCIDDPVTLQSTCVRCGNRCHIRGHEDYKGPSCPNTCGKRETVFRGVNTLNLFGAWLFSETQKFFTAVARTTSWVNCRSVVCSSLFRRVNTWFLSRCKWSYLV
jgi:hypothetical protein